MPTTFSLFNKNLYILKGLLLAVIFIPNVRSMDATSSIYAERNVIHDSGFQVRPYSCVNWQLSNFSNSGIITNGNTYNILCYAPQTIYFNYNPIYNVPQNNWCLGNLYQGNILQGNSPQGSSFQSASSSVNQPQGDLSRRDLSQETLSRGLDIDTNIVSEKRSDPEASNDGDTLKRELSDRLSGGWTDSNQSLDELIGSETYKTVILEVNKLDNKRFQSSNEILMEKMQNTMCNNNVDKQKKVQLNSKSVGIEVAETVMKALTHVCVPGFLG